MGWQTGEKNNGGHVTSCNGLQGAVLTLTGDALDQPPLGTQATFTSLRVRAEPLLLSFS